MDWRLSHHHPDHPCSDARWSRPRPCPASSEHGLSTRIRDVVAELPTEIGITYEPAPGDGEWLWCLGGPDVLKHPSEDHVARDMCADLHLSVCDKHHVISIDIEGHDIVPTHGHGTG